ncbi:MAG: hypothetical protein U0998_08330 [Moraxellaceae bacterium]|nr:hypothetical protein [Moraxellaceae bacterium]MDP1775616.1 hypothetical protein [Moraxellaceae bacterium]MDZ4298470.1 hypothetical protein [Moraxellaceae bacterium]MDZ4387199.1 hypothetical protein [Moraxellaceae bacterium]
MIRVLALLLLLILSGCSTMPPTNSTNLCSVFTQKKAWTRPALQAELKWEIPVPVMMATIFHESSYRAKARPSRRYFLGFIPGPRRSSAYGYAQAIDGTWGDYVDRNNRWFASRDNFADAIDFVGWYHNNSVRRNGITPNDAYNLYLAYHEGNAGYARRTFERKPWLMNYARRVEQTSNNYQQQLTRCPLR